MSTYDNVLEQFLQENVQRGGPGFYAKDAYRMYQEWADVNGHKLVLGQNNFASQVEVKGWRRQKRRGVTFFANGTLVGSKRRVNYL